MLRAPLSRLLVRHPRAMDRLRREVTAVLGNTQQPSREQVRKMPFLASVIKESMFLCCRYGAYVLLCRSNTSAGLRLYPPVPFNNRQAIRTTILPTGGGPNGKNPILVQKGELVVFSQYVNSRVKSIYGLDADEFRPERWEGDELAKIGWAYFPFNGGPRQCLGEDFALMEVSYTVVRLLQACSRRAQPSHCPRTRLDDPWAWRSKD